MNIKKLVRKRKIRDAWVVPPSAPLINRLVRGLVESQGIIQRYFPQNRTESEYVNLLDDMVHYFNDYNKAGV